MLWFAAKSSPSELGGEFNLQSCRPATMRAKTFRTNLLERRQIRAVNPAEATLYL